MNIIFLTQSRTLSLFHDVAKAMHHQNAVEKIGFYLSDSTFFRIYRKSNPELISGKYKLLKEWDIIRESRKITPDLDLLEKYEMKYGNPFLWDALVADRRIILGKRTTLEQDYRSRFSHERMLTILQVGIDEMEKFFDKVKPDLVVSFICVTIGEYLAYLISKHKMITFINLRPTRIKNYFFAGKSVLEPSARLRKSYKNLLKTGIPDDLYHEAITYIRNVRSTHAMYEGVLTLP